MSSKKEIYNLLFGFPFEGVQIDNNIVFSSNDKNTINAEDVLNNLFASADYDDGKFFNSDGETIGTVDDFEQFFTFKELNVCIYCNGDGYVESDASYACDKPASMCCGGCSVTLECECELIYKK